MKKIILLLMLVMAVVADAMAQNNAMYVYRNDGVINAFLKTNIDSIRYSQIDIDSVAHKEFVVQEIWTPDSVYRTPMEKIDSIGLTTPSTIYQPGAVNITAEMREYIVASDSLCLTFASNTPQNLLPNIGDNIVNTEGSGGLMSGFLGKVMNIENTSDGYCVKCSAIDITDVFERYYCVFSTTQELPVSSKQMLGNTKEYPKPYIYEPGTLSFNLGKSDWFQASYEKDGNLLTGELDDDKFNFNLTPRVVITTSLITLHGKKYYSLDIDGDYSTEELLALSGSITNAPSDIPLIPVHIPCAGILMDVDFELGIFINAGLTISTKQHWTQHYKSKFHWSNNDSDKTINSFKQTGDTHSGIIALKGTFATGLYLNFGISFIPGKIWEIAKIYLRGEAGPQFEGTALPYISNKGDALSSTELYKMLKGNGVSRKLVLGFSVNAEMFGVGVKVPLGEPIEFGPKGFSKTMLYVPDFSKTMLQKNEDGSIFASMDISGDCNATDMGFSLQNQNDASDCVNGYCVYDYNGPSSSAYSTFYSKPSKSPYIVYPLVKFGELEMIAEPSATLSLLTCPEDNHPHAIDLGLPSGTKWCCMNVGATAPEGYGGFYAWGETSEKSVYNEVTYKYCSGTDTDGNGWYDKNETWQNIGSDIAGTSYDAAHVNMGGSWVMPSTTQQQELINNCSREWTQQNGVNGTLVTGPNGGKIFLPAAGYRLSDYLNDAGSYGDYWSSSLSPDSSNGAYGLGFGSGGWGWYDYNRYDGQSVRAVCP